MNQYDRIPLLLIAADKTEIGINISSLVLAARMTPEQVIAKYGQIEADTEVAVVDINSSDRRNVVVCALLLRNAGKTAVVCDVQNIPVELVQDIHSFSIRKKSEGFAVRTEVLLMDDAMQRFGDISDIVADFEREYLSN